MKRGQPLTLDKQFSLFQIIFKIVVVYTALKKENINARN